MQIVQKIEALLFWKAEPVSFKKLAILLGANEKVIIEGLDELEKSLKGRGITLIRTDDMASLGTSPEASFLIEQLAKDELSGDLSKAALETLSIILYKGPISRSEIDYIRGVNSQFILRNLLVRGLIEKIDNPSDGRGFLYKTSVALLSNLGISKISNLPEYAEVRKEIDAISDNKEVEKN